MEDYRRAWRKLHIGLDADSQQVVTALLSDSRVIDSRCLPRHLRHARQLSNLKPS